MSAQHIDVHGLPALPEGTWVSEVPVGDPLYTADQMRDYARAALRQSGEAVAWVSPFGGCVCEGMNQCPGCNPNEAIELAKELAAKDERLKYAPCIECGAKDANEAETLCLCAGDKDDCHGCQLWPDGVTAPPATPGLVEALDHIGGLSRALRSGGPDPMDLQELSDALEEAVNTAHAALAALAAHDARGAQ